MSLHRARSSGCRSSLLEPHAREPPAPGADGARDVDADPLVGDEIEVFAIRRPIPVFRLRIVFEPPDRELAIPLADRRGRVAAVSDHVRRHTLADRALRRGLDEDADIAVRVNVDETGGDIRPRRVDCPGAFRTPE